MHCCLGSADWFSGRPKDTCSPEVSNDLILLCVTPVVCVLLPVLDVDICNTTNEQFQFALIEDVDQIRRNEFVEASHKGIKLFLYSFLNSPFSDEPM